MILSRSFSILLKIYVDPAFGRMRKIRRKKTLSVTLYLEKTVCEIRDRFGGQITYQEGTTKDYNTPLNP